MLKIGLIGWGYWGRNYAKYFDASVDAELVTVCDSRPEMLKDAKRSYPHVKTSEDALSLLKEKLDGVILALPASTHFKLAVPFIKAKIPILIEKPLTDSFESAQELEILANKEKTKVLVGHTFLYNQSVRFLKTEIDTGKLGRIYYLEFKRQSYGPIRDDVNVIWDFAPHDIAIAKYLLNDKYPLSVYAQAGKYSRNAMEDIAIIILKFPDNVLVNINVAWLYPIKIRSLTLLGDKKMAVFDDTNTTEPVRIYDTSLQYPTENEPSQASFRLGDVYVPRIQPIDPLATQLKHFINYINAKEKPLTPISDGVEVTAILEAINQSLKQKTEVFL